MNWADWIVIAILGASVAISLIRGFVREALSLAIWAAAFIVAMLFHARFSVLLTDLITTVSVRYATAWLALFLAVLLSGSLLSYLLGQLISSTGLSGTDRLLGGVFGALRGFILVMALLIFLPAALPVNQDSWWQQSVLIPYFLEWEGWFRDVADQSFNFFKLLF